MKKTDKSSTTNSVLGQAFQKARRQAYLDTILTQRSLKLRDLLNYCKSQHADAEIIGDISIAELSEGLAVDKNQEAVEVYGRKPQVLRIDEYDNQILEILKSLNGRYATSAYIRERFNGTFYVFGNRMRKLRDLGLVEMSGATNGACYRLALNNSVG